MRALFLLLVLGLPHSPLAAADRPNVLFIAVDDLNDWVGCLGGSPDCKTPHIDRLAKRGVLFRNAHCAAPACNPSRAALMTGVRPSTSGVYHNSQPWQQPLKGATTLNALFKNSGYRTVAGGKIYHGGYGDDPAHWDHYEKQTGDPRPKPEVANDPHSQAGGIVWGRLDAEDQELHDYRTVSWAVAELGKKHEQPFFLACGLSRPHMPWQVPQKYYDQYPLESITLPKVPADDLQDVPAAGIRMARPNGDHATILETDNWKYAVQGYLAAISFADAQIGRLLEALDASPHKDNTIIVFWGDHGWHLGEKQHWRKFSLWEEATRAPLIIAAPGIQPAVCDAPVDFVSIYPTLVELAGLKLPATVEGASLLPLLNNPTADWTGVAITTHGRNNHAVRDSRYRYIRYADGSEELYDHRSDPMEWKNLASDPALQSVKEELSGRLPKQNTKDAPTRKETKPAKPRKRAKLTSGAKSAE